MQANGITTPCATRAYYAQDTYSSIRRALKTLSFTLGYSLQMLHGIRTEERRTEECRTEECRTNEC